jgi:ectoine hydroxylase-related dioxygenase (phytanoyl-CoA dioxygenase family)
VCTDHVAALLRSIDGAASHTIHQTIIFFIPPATDMHIDGWGLDSQPFGYSHTLWIPLEQVHLRNGPIAIVPWKLGRFMSPQELGFDRFLQGDDQGTREDYHQYQDRLLAHIRRNHPDCVVPQLEPGDMVLFSSLTPHATLPYNGGYPSRRAMQIMLRDSSRAWASWPQQFREKTANPPDEPRDRIQSVNEQWRILM